MGHLYPSKLRALRERRNLSQLQLASEADLSQKQISRLETVRQQDGPNKCHGRTLHKLANALGVPEDELTSPPEHDAEAKAEAAGLKRVSFYLTEQDQVHYRFLEARYGAKAHDVFRVAPLLFLIAAEMSLAERRENLRLYEEALSTVPTDRINHLEDVSAGLFRAQEASAAEQQSIEERDLSGSSIAEDEWSWSYKGTGDLFVDFLKRKVRELAPEAFGDADEISGRLGSLYVELFLEQIQELSAGSPLASFALKRGYVHPKDIPSELMDEEKSSARAGWIEAQCSDETRSAHEQGIAALNDFALSVKT